MAIQSDSKASAGKPAQLNWSEVLSSREGNQMVPVHGHLSVLGTLLLSAPVTICMLLCGLQHTTFSRRLYVWRQHSVLHGNLSIFFQTDIQRYQICLLLLQEAVTFCMPFTKPQNDSSACFSLYLCSNPTNTSSASQITDHYRSYRFQQEKETNHVVRGACEGKQRKS